MNRVAINMTEWLHQFVISVTVNEGPSDAEVQLQLTTTTLKAQGIPWKRGQKYWNCQGNRVSTERFFYIGQVSYTDKISITQS